MVIKNYRVLVCEDAPGTLLDGLTGSDGPGCPVAVTYEPSIGRDQARLAAELGRFDGLVVRNRTMVDAGLLRRAGKLRVIGRLGAGLDNIDLTAAVQRGIAVVYAPYAGSSAVAEHTMALMLALARRLPQHCRVCREGVWRRHSHALELRGRTLGILGFGAVGRHVAQLARAFGMEVITHHPRLASDHPDLAVPGVTLVTAEELFRRAQVLSIHLPDRPDTRAYVNYPRLSLLPRGALVINTGRGTVVCEQSLLALLRQGHIAGAALDVRAQEPPPAGDELVLHPNVIATPHVAGLTIEAQHRVGRQVAADVRRVLSGLPPERPALSSP